MLSTVRMRTLACMRVCFGTLLARHLGTRHGICLRFGTLRFGTLALGLLGCKVVVSAVTPFWLMCLGALVLCFGVFWAGSLAVLVAPGPVVCLGASGAAVRAPVVSMGVRLGALLGTRGG